MVELKRSLSKKVKSTLGITTTPAESSINFNKDFTSLQSPIEGLQAVKYEEIDPLSPVNSNSIITNKTSSTSLPALVKRSKSYLSTRSFSGTKTSSSESFAGSKRQSSSSLATKYSNKETHAKELSSRENSIQLPCYFQQDIIRAMSTKKDSEENQRLEPLKLDLLPPNPSKSPVDESQLSPLHSRITTPIFESQPFFVPENEHKTWSSGSDDVDYAALFSSASRSHQLRSRQNSSATSMSSHNAVTNSSFLSKSQQIFLGETPGFNEFMTSVIYNNKELVKEDDVSESELQNAFSDEIAIGILDKVGVEGPEIKPKTLFEFDERRIKRNSEWYI